MAVTINGTNGVTFNNGTTQSVAGVTSLNGQTGDITNTGTNSIGSYIPAVAGGASSVYTYGATIAGSSLRTPPDGYATNAFGSFYSDQGTNNPSLTGTWRAMSRSANSEQGDGSFFYGNNLWVRIS